MRSAREIITALGGNEHTGMCRCPAHDDKTPSLHVSEKNGKVLVHCHAGCSQERVIDALSAKGLSPLSSKEKDRMRNYRSEEEDEPEQDSYHKALAILRAAAGAVGNPRDWSTPDHTARLRPYLNGRGIKSVPENAMWLSPANADRLTGIHFPAMVMPILGAKGLQGCQATFLSRDSTKNLRSKNGNSVRRFYGSAKGGYVPIGDARPNHPVIMTEGVEDALSVAQVTHCAAIAGLSADNLKHVMTPRCSEVIVAGDNDDIGIGAAEAAATLLADRGYKVRIAIPKGFKDWNEAAVSENGDADELADLILSSRKVKGSREVRPITMTEFLAMQFPPRDYLIKPWLESSSSVMVHGYRGEGKTWFGLSVAYALATGRRLLGWEVNERRVLYVDGELSGPALQKRLKLMGPGTDNLTLLTPDLWQVKRKLMPNLADEDARNWLDQQIEGGQQDVVILDSLSTLIRGVEENDAGAWEPIQTWILEHRGHGRSVIFLHHQGRSRQPRGTSKREDIVESVIGLKKRSDLSGDTDTAFELVFDKSRDFFGVAAQPLIIRLSTQSGQVQWTHETVRDHTREHIRKLWEAGVKQTDIAKEVGLTQPRVSQILTELKREGNTQREKESKREGNTTGERKNISR